MSVISVTSSELPSTVQSDTSVPITGSGPGKM